MVGFTLFTAFIDLGRKREENPIKSMGVGE